MKKRFEELAIQAAGLGFDTFATSDLDSQAKIERFAELIVRECVVMTKGYEFALGRKDELSKTMREHFGVEE